VTLLICTSGRPRLLDRCLDAIQANSARPNQVVIVNGADGKTPAVVERHAHAFGEVVLVEHPNQNLATLRNLGLPFCTGEIVAMTDDDAVPAPNWVAGIQAAHRERPEAGGIGGAVRGLSRRFVSRVADAVVFPDPRPGRPIHTLPTVNMSYKRAAIEAVGGFDETLFRGEDVDYNWRIIQAGYDIAFDPGMKVEHQHRSTLRGLYQQQYMYGRAYVLVRTKWPAMYCVYPHSLGSLRSWAKLAHAGIAIVYQPFGVARSMPSPIERIAAYPVLVVHHLIWKLGMARQFVAMRSVMSEPSPAREKPLLTRWIGGKRTADVLA